MSLLLAKVTVGFLQGAQCCGQHRSLNELESQAQHSFGLIWNEVTDFLLLHYTPEPLPPFRAL